MKLFTEKYLLRGFLLMIALIVVVLLTILPRSSPLLYPLGFVFSGDVMGAVGHAGLFGMFTAGMALVFSGWLSRRKAVMLAVVLALCIATATEYAQSLGISRSATLTDLLGNYVGIFLVGFIISIFWMRE